MVKGALAEIQLANLPELTPKIWDDLRLFSIVNSANSFAKAAEFTKINQTTIARRISFLEDTLGAELLRRSSSGVTPTETGTKILQRIEEIENQVRQIERLAKGKSKVILKNIKVASPDGFAQYLLAPALPKLRDMAPDVSVSLLCLHTNADLEKNQADVSLGFQPYDSFDIVNMKLGQLRMQPFASPAYLAEHGEPKSLGDLETHTLIDHLAYGIDEGDWSLWQKAQRRLAPHKANLSSVHYEMVASGMGIGILPNYAVTKGQVKPLNLGYELEMSIYLSYPRSNRGRSEIQNTRDWLKWIFKKQHHEWFG